MNRDKCQFLFGEDMPPIDLDDDDELIEFFVEDWEHDDLLAIPPTMLAASAKLIIGGEPATWATAQRLTGIGLDRHETLEQIAFAIRYEVQRTTPGDDASAHEPGLDDARLGMLLDSLPLADDAELIDAVEEVMSSGGARDEDSVVAAVLTELGLPADAELLVDQVRRTIEAGAIAGVLQFLPGDLLVHVPALTAGIILTHRLGDDEIDRHTLRCIGDDLAGFDSCEDLRLAGDRAEGANGDSEIRIIILEHGERVWRLPDQTFSGFAHGELVAISVDDTGGVTIERIDEPAPNHVLVELFAATYARQIEEIDMAGEMAVLLVAVLVAAGDSFTKPQLPLTELCRLAGLEVRGENVGKSEESWAELRRAERSARLFAAADGHEVCAADAEHVLDTLELRFDDDDAIRDALHLLRHDHVTKLVVDELIDPEPANPDCELALAIGERLTAVATRGADVEAAHMVLGVIHERSGRPDRAEQCFATGQMAKLDSPRLIDRLGWYASDRGDAKAAARWWQMLDDDRGQAEAIAAFARPSHPHLGRNEPCWCGSGRKYKACHLGVIERPPLPDRVGWIMHKSFEYVRRHGGAAVVSVIGAAAAWAGDDIGSVGRAIDDPIVFDTVLTEGGWMARFLADRGPLLPADEATLVGSWLPIGRSVYEFDDVMPGGNVEARDLRTGDTVSVRAHSTSAKRLPAGVLLARAVPDGEGHQFIGAVQVIPADRRDEALSLCADADGDAICAFVGSLRRRRS